MLNRLLSTRFTELQIERILRSETIAALLSAEVDRTIRNALSRRRPDVIADILRRLPQKLTTIADTAFLRFARWSRREAAAVFATTLPRKWFREVVPASVLVGEEVGDGEPDFLFVDDVIGPVVGKKMDDDEWQQWVQNNVWPSPTTDHVRRIIDTTTAGLTWQKRIENLSRLIQPEVTAQRLSDGFSRGLNVDDLAREILPHIDGNVRASAKRIARTEGLRIANTMQTEMFSDLGNLMVGTQIVATLDENTRPHHALRNGRIHYTDRRRRPNMDTMPVLPDEPNCIIPGQYVEGRFCGASRAFYSGQTIELRTSQGRTVTVTPNHPVLTLRGFVPAKDVGLADQLVCNHSGAPLPVVMPDNHENPPALIEEVFSALADGGQAFRVNATPEQFHGDGEFIKGDVYLVRADSELRSDVETTSTEDVDQLNLCGTVMKSSSLPSPGTLTLPAEPVDVATSSSMRGSESGGSIGSGDLTPLEFLSFGAASILGTVFEQQTNETERVAFTVPQTAPGYTEFFRQLIDRLSSVVAIDNITDIRIGEFTGHVYDLQSDCEMYSAGGIIVHNCRCFPVPVMRTPDEVKNDPKLAAEFQNNAGDAIPDPESYDQWFSGASQDRRELAVGKRRYREMRKTLGRNPEWKDFVDEEGKLIPLKRLKSESEKDRNVRRKSVDLLIQQRRQMLQDIKATGFELPRDKKRKPRPKKVTKKTSPKKKPAKAPSIVDKRKAILANMEKDRQDKFSWELGPDVVRYANPDDEHKMPRTKERVALYRKQAKIAAKAAEKRRKRFLAEAAELERELDEVKTALRDLNWFTRPEENERLKGRLAALRQEKRALLAKEFAPDIPMARMEMSGKHAMSTEGQKAQEFVSSLLSIDHAANNDYASLKNGIMKVPVKTTPDGREFHRPADGIFMTSKSKAHVFVHELGHAIERERQTHELAKGFLYHRVGNEKVRNMADFSSAYKRSDGEVGREDEFGKALKGASSAAYTGKAYVGATEVLSMGMEELYRDPAAFARNDPEWFDFVTGVLRGDLLQ